MTSRSRGQEPSTLSFRRELPSPEHVVERIRTITGELTALEAEIYGQIADPEELLDRRALLQQAGAASVLVDFKIALDQLRSILWFCESASSSLEDEGIGGRERELARATELLKALSPAGFSISPKESGSFFERLDRVIDNYMQDESVSRKSGQISKA